MADLIDRQAAIDALWKEPSYSDPLNVLAEARDRIKDLPSAQPERKKGKWIEFDYPWFQCSECGAVREQKSFLENFCPNCGADMRGEE